MNFINYANINLQELQTFKDSIVKNPFDLSIPLIMADWLDDHEWSDEAALVRFYVRIREGAEGQTTTFGGCDCSESQWPMPPWEKCYGPNAPWRHVHRLGRILACAFTMDSLRSKKRMVFHDAMQHCLFYHFGISPCLFYRVDGTSYSQEGRIHRNCRSGRFICYYDVWCRLRTLTHRDILHRERLRQAGMFKQFIDRTPWEEALRISQSRRHLWHYLNHLSGK